MLTEAMCPIYDMIKCCGQCGNNFEVDNGVEMVCIFSDNPTIDEWEEYNKMMEV